MTLSNVYRVPRLPQPLLCGNRVNRLPRAHSPLGVRAVTIKTIVVRGMRKVCPWIPVRIDCRFADRREGSRIGAPICPGPRRELPHHLGKDPQLPQQSWYPNAVQSVTRLRFWFWLQIRVRNRSLAGQSACPVRQICPARRKATVGRATVGRSTASGKKARTDLRGVEVAHHWPSLSQGPRPGPSACMAFEWARMQPQRRQCTRSTPGSCTRRTRCHWMCRRVSPQPAER